MLSLSTFLVAMIAALVATSGYATTYRCTSESGKITFQGKPCPIAKPERTRESDFNRLKRRDLNAPHASAKKLDKEAIGRMVETPEPVAEDSAVPQRVDTDDKTTGSAYGDKPGDIKGTLKDLSKQYMEKLKAEARKKREGKQ